MSNQYRQQASASQQRAQEQKRVMVQNQQTFGQMLKSKQKAIASVIPKHISADRLLSVAMVAVNKTPALLECHLPSVVSAVHHCVSLGFEPNNALGQAYIVPFKNSKANRKEAQVILGYKGLAALMRRSGDITFFDGQVVYDCDQFDFEYGTNEYLKHKPSLHRPSDAKIIAAYSVARMKGSNEINFRVVGESYLESVYEDVKNKNFGNAPVWDKHPEPMRIKTAMRSHSKYLPLSIEMADVLDMEDKQHNGESQNTGLFDNVIDVEPITTTDNPPDAICQPEPVQTETVEPETTTEPAATVNQSAETKQQETPDGVPAGSREVEL